MCVLITYYLVLGNSNVTTFITVYFFLLSRYYVGIQFRHEFLASCASDIISRNCLIHSVLLFPPLNSHKRFLIHKACEKYQRLGTFSIGQGFQRRVVIYSALHTKCHLIVDSNRQQEAAVAASAVPSTITTFENRWANANVLEQILLINRQKQAHVSCFLSAVPVAQRIRCQRNG